MKKMMRSMIFYLLSSSVGNIYAQTGPAFTSWMLNLTGKVATYYATSNGMPPTYTWTVTTDSADVLKIAYNTSYVYIRSNGLTDSMGKFLNPGTCISQGYTHKFPRTVTVPATKTISPKGGQIGLLINGVPIYGLGNATSWNGTANANNGSGVWNAEVGKYEGFVLDANYGAHPQQQGAYHSHDKPYRLYKYYATNVHSPLIGYAFDGNPVYGPYGYSTALNAAGAVTRMKTGYSLRNISVRTTLPYGVTASQTGPPVSTTYPIGSYCEDYEWLASNGGDLDKYNGRYCVTPEYPGGTYAYFVTIDAAGAAAFPYYIGIEYYGAPETSNFPVAGGSNTVTIPAGVSYYTGSVVAIKLSRFEGASNGNVNNLFWSLSNTGSLAGITLERSSDGNQFYPIAEFSGSAAADYQYIDQKPFAKNFYRLKIKEASGSSGYSGLVVLSDYTKSSVFVYPTVTTGTVNVRGLNSSSGSIISITDLTGRKIMTKEFSAGKEQVSIDLSSLQKGIYFISVENNGQREAVKIFR